VTFSFVLPRLTPSGAAPKRTAGRDRTAIADVGRRALAEGNFYQAARELSRPGLLDGYEVSPAELRDFDQRRRQAELLSRLHGRSLQEVLHEAVPLRTPDEWKARFQSQHVGKSVVFDDVVGRDKLGRPSLAVYRIRAGDEEARVALEDLRLLWRLPIDPPQRMLFGGQLSDLTREDGGGWVFRFEPESMVLLTDPGAVAACVGPPDVDLLAVLERQQQWLADLARGPR
jgi:hypothetical protein